MCVLIGIMLTSKNVRLSKQARDQIVSRISANLRQGVAKEDIMSGVAVETGYSLSGVRALVTEAQLKIKGERN